MNRHKFEAFLKEFPFLQQVLELQLSRTFRENSYAFKAYDHATVTSVTVQRIDENWLRTTLVDFCHNGSAGETVQWQDLWAVLPDGSIERVPVKHKYSFSSNYAHTKSENRDGEPIIEAMEGFEQAVAFVMVERDTDNWRGQYDAYDHRKVVIYKASRRTSVAAEIEKARRQAEHEVAIELEQVLDDSVCPCCGQPLEKEGKPQRPRKEEEPVNFGASFREMLEQSLKDDAD